MNLHKFYFDHLPKFTMIFKELLKEKLQTKENLNIEDNVKVFFEFFKTQSAFAFFKNYEITKDEMYIGIYLNDFESKVYMERKIRLDDVDEEYQIQFELVLDLPPTKNRFSESFEVERNYSGDFSNWEQGYFHFEDYEENVFSVNELNNLTTLYPKSVRISLNADF
ncbi:hypothetical protein [Flavobacterium sp.]|uniref:hypothetical protein n=1 Tax=Flavobacterium sp. TaxID=239 RepID=UPI0031D1009D